MATESLVNRARLLAGDLVTAPGLDSLGNAIWDDVATMIRAVEAGDKVAGEGGARTKNAALRSAPVHWAAGSDGDELRRDAACCPIGRIVERRQIFFNELALVPSDL